MIELPVYNRAGSEIDKVTVDETRLGTKVHLQVLRDTIIMYEANLRQGTSSTKGRSEVSGSSRKPWAQKHTGRARVGTIRSPIWRHGGIVFGPKPRDFSYRFPKKMLQRAVDSALLSKFQDKEAIIIDSISLENPNTQEIVKLLKTLGITSSCLIGVEDNNRALHLSARNIPNVMLRPVKDFNAYIVLKYKNLILTKKALEEITNRPRLYSPQTGGSGVKINDKITV